MLAGERRVGEDGVDGHLVAESRGAAGVGDDDFALRRCHDYITVLINADTGARIDVLPGRGAEVVAGWLRTHPGVESLCRDGSAAYAPAVRDALPHAVQIADRWHPTRATTSSRHPRCSNSRRPPKYLRWPITSTDRTMINTARGNQRSCYERGSLLAAGNSNRNCC